MEDKPRRRCFQIHLSTAVVLMFVVGLLLWLNMPKRSIYSCDAPSSERPYEAGFPFERMLISFPYWHNGLDRRLEIRSDLIGVVIDQTGYVLKLSTFGLNLGITICVLFVAVCGMEYLIRRRKPPA